MCAQLLTQPSSLRRKCTPEPLPLRLLGRELLTQPRRLNRRRRLNRSSRTCRTPSRHILGAPLSSPTRLPPHPHQPIPSLCRPSVCRPSLGRRSLSGTLCGRSHQHLAQPPRRGFRALRPLPLLGDGPECGALRGAEPPIVLRLGCAHRMLDGGGGGARRLGGARLDLRVHLRADLPLEIRSELIL